MKLHPLAERLSSQPGAQAVGLAGLDEFAAGPGPRALFFSGDPVRFPEGADVAVVLPELARACATPFVIGVVARQDEDAIARRYGVRHWPTVVFLRDGSYRAQVSGMKDWSDFVVEVRRALDAPPARPPIAVIAATPAGSSCH